MVSSVLNIRAALWADVEREKGKAKVVLLQTEAVNLNRQLQEYTIGTGSSAYFGATVSSAKSAAIGGLMYVGHRPRRYAKRNDADLREGVDRLNDVAGTNRGDNSAQATKQSA